MKRAESSTERVEPERKKMKTRGKERDEPEDDPINEDDYDDEEDEEEAEEADPEAEKRVTDIKKNLEDLLNARKVSETIYKVRKSAQIHDIFMEYFSISEEISGFPGRFHSIPREADSPEML